MTLPVGFPLISVTGGAFYRLSDGSLPTRLRVTLTPSVDALLWDGNTVQADAYPLTVDLTTGTVSGSVPATDHPDVAPQGWYYTVREWVNGKMLRDPWRLEVPYDGGALDLDTAAPMTVIAGVPTAVGPAPDITIGTVSTVAEGGAATAAITGTTPDLVLNLGIPVGATGATGPRGLSVLFIPSDTYPGLYDLVETSDLDTTFSEDPLHPGLYTIGT